MARPESIPNNRASAQETDFFGIKISLEPDQSLEEGEIFWETLKEIIGRGGGVTIWLDSRDTETLHYSLVTGWPANPEDPRDVAQALTCILPLPLFAFQLGYTEESQRGEEISFPTLRGIVEKIQEPVHRRIWLGDGDMWRRLHGLFYDRLGINQDDSDKVLLSSAVLATKTALALWTKIAQGHNEFDYDWVEGELKPLKGKVALANYGVNDGSLAMVVSGGIKKKSVGVEGPNGWVIYEPDEVLAEKIADESGAPLLKHKGRWSRSYHEL